MKYLHVAGKPSPGRVDFNPAILRQTNLCLYSLIEGLRQKDFNTHTLAKVIENIQGYSRAYVAPVNGEIFTDSGGYSIIAGFVSPEDILRFIACYNVYAVHERNVYHSIFSLDIPWSKKFDSLNTKQRIYEFNLMSLLSARDILQDYPEVKEKYYFVWHFKMLSQYLIWKDIYDSLGLNSLVKNRAIGGMVALRGATGINFSPFTPLAYRCLLDYLETKDYSRPFTLHFLGMYIPYDRFQIALLEHLFRRYFEGQIGVKLTYDSINYTHTVRMNKGLQLYVPNGADLDVYPSLVDAPRELLKSIYVEDVDFIAAEIERRRAGHNLVHSDSFAALNIFSNKAIDNFFSHVVDSYGIADMFFKFKSSTRILHEVGLILEELRLKYSQLFTKSTIHSIMKNIELTFLFHDWFVNYRDYVSLNGMVIDFIRDIKFPSELR